MTRLALLAAAVLSFGASRCDWMEPSPRPSPPAPSPSPAPSPPPATIVPPSPLPSPPGCGLPPLAECGRTRRPYPPVSCCVHPVPEGESARFRTNIAMAINATRAKRPELFRGTVVLEFDAYVLAVVEELRGQGLCAVRGFPLDEVGVKNSQERSEQWDIHIGGSGQVRYGGFVAVCKPARF